MKKLILLSKQNLEEKEMNILKSKLISKISPFAIGDKVRVGNETSTIEAISLNTITQNGEVLVDLDTLSYIIMSNGNKVRKMLSEIQPISSQAKFILNEDQLSDVIYKSKINTVSDLSTFLTANNVIFDTKTLNQVFEKFKLDKTGIPKTKSIKLSEEAVLDILNSILKTADMDKAIFTEKFAPIYDETILNYNFEIGNIVYKKGTKYLAEITGKDGNVYFIKIADKILPVWEQEIKRIK